MSRTRFGGARWRFETLTANYVELQPTERDLFSGDNLELAEGLVREVVQNSLDAKAPGADPVQVEFTLAEVSGDRADQLRETLTGLERHLDACGLPRISDDDPIRVLVIEDFGTKGLTGATDTLDELNFNNFWRRHGGGNKIGSAGGRWGLGKIVFSSSSEIRTFFGYTVRDGDERGLLMGQAVLSGHRIDGKRQTAHGFWHADTGDDNIQLPLADPESIAEFLAIHPIRRRLQDPGFSIVIPFVKQSLTDTALIAAVVKHYYFAILAGRLEVLVGDVRITRANFDDISKKYLGNALPMTFIQGVSVRQGSEPTATAKIGLDVAQVTKSSFDPDDLDRIRKRFEAHEVVHVRLPVTVTPKGGAALTSFVDVFLLKIFSSDHPFSMFVRGSLTVPLEANRFQSSLVKAALIASDDGACAFIGDAENASHTSLSNNAEKLLERWSSPMPTIKHIRSALRDVHGLIVEHNARRDREALIDFFFLPSENTVNTTERRKTVVEKVPDIERNVEPFEIVGRNGGFDIGPNPDPAIANLTAYPFRIEGRLAYAVITGEALRLHSDEDFKLNHDGVTITGDDGVEIAINPFDNASFIATVKRSQFRISATGFDPRRDLVVSANLVSTTPMEASQ